MDVWGSGGQACILWIVYIVGLVQIILGILFFCLGVARILFIIFLLEMGLYSLVQTEIPFGWITDGLMKDLISFGHMCMYQ